VNDQILIGLNGPNLKSDGCHRGDHSVACKCADPRFNPESDTLRPRFCRQLMKKADGFPFSFRFAIYGYLMCARGERKRKPRRDLLCAINALLQGMSFYYDPLTNRVDRSLPALAQECGLATISHNGTISVTRAHRAARYLENEYGFIVRGGEGIFFTPAFFRAIKVRPDHLRAARLKSERLHDKRESL
jgi:incFII family plasmid replication initiator RepA